MRLPSVRPAPPDPLAVELARLRKLRHPSKWQQCYAFAKDWQAALVGIFGFIGIGFTIDGQIHADSVEQKTRELREANHLRFALAAELNSVAATDRGVAVQLQKSGDSPVVSTLPQDVIFQHDVDKLGLLTEDETETIYAAYYQQRQYVYLIAAALTPIGSVGGFFTVKKENYVGTGKLFDALANTDERAATVLIKHVELD